MLSARDSWVAAGALLVLSNTYCTGVPVEPAETESSPAVVEWVAASVRAWADPRLAASRQLRVDLEAPAGTYHARGWLVPGEAVVARPDDLISGDWSGVLVLNGGADASRPLVFKDVVPGTYTVCGQLVLAREADWDSAPLRCSRIEVTDAGESRSLVLRG
jgi:hypothetical protein